MSNALAEAKAKRLARLQQQQQNSLVNIKHDLNFGSNQQISKSKKQSKPKNSVDTKLSTLEKKLMNQIDSLQETVNILENRLASTHETINNVAEARFINKPDGIVVDPFIFETIYNAFNDIYQSSKKRFKSARATGKLNSLNTVKQFFDKFHNS